MAHALYGTLCVSLVQRALSRFSRNQGHGQERDRGRICFAWNILQDLRSDADS